jgi:PncC family amidohydrolase
MKRESTRLIRHLQRRKLTLALAESMTCGCAARQLGMVKGTMDVFRGSLVCYHPVVKVKVLGIPRKLLVKFSPESQEVTDAMAERLYRLFRTDVVGAVTGLAAPGGSERKGKPVGTVFLTVMYRKKKTRRRKLFRGTASEIEAKACKALFRLIIRATQ